MLLDDPDGRRRQDGLHHLLILRQERRPGREFRQGWRGMDPPPITEPGPSEAAVAADLIGDGAPELLPNTVSTVVFYDLKSATDHGVGIGDVNGDGWIGLLTPRVGSRPSKTHRATPGPDTPSGLWARSASRSSPATASATSPTTRATIMRLLLDQARETPRRRAGLKQTDQDRLQDRLGPYLALGRP